MIRTLLVGFVVLLAQPVAASELIVQVTDGAGNAVADAVIGLVPQGDGPIAAPPPGPRQIVDQSNETFVPLVTIVPRGGEVEFHNSDRTRHHVYSFSPARVFEFVLAPGEVSEVVRLDRTGVVAVGCNIHDQMVSYLYVTEQSRTVLSDGAGRARLPDLPAGAYVLRAWHPRLRPGRPEPSQTVTVTSDVSNATVTLSLLAKPPVLSGHEQRRY
jgi:hypothetical protein